MARFEIIERYPSELIREHGSWLDRLFIPWAVRTIADADSIEEAKRLRDELERERPEIAPLGIWDADTEYTDKGGVTHREWIDFPWRHRWRRRARLPHA